RSCRMAPKSRAPAAIEHRRNFKNRRGFREGAEIFAPTGPAPVAPELPRRRVFRTQAKQGLGPPALIAREGTRAVQTAAPDKGTAPGTSLGGLRWQGCGAFR